MAKLRRNLGIVSGILGAALAAGCIPYQQGDNRPALVCSQEDYGNCQDLPCYNNELVCLNDELKRDANALEQIIASSSERKELMLRLMRENPAIALENAMPEASREKFPEQVKGNVEEYVTKRGFIHLEHIDDVGNALVHNDGISNHMKIAVDFPQFSVQKILQATSRIFMHPKNSQSQQSFFGFSGGRASSSLIFSDGHDLYELHFADISPPFYLDGMYMDIRGYLLDGHLLLNEKDAEHVPY